MFALGEALRRFRVGAVPGAPSAAGVPSDRVTQLEAELGPVFAALAGPEAQAAALVGAATERAEQIRKVAHERARQTIAEATAQAPAERAAAAAQLLEQAAGERAQLVHAAEAEAARIDAIAAERTKPLIAEVVARVLAAANETPQ